MPKPGDGPLDENNPFRTNPIGCLLATLFGIGLPGALGGDGWLWWIAFVVGAFVGFIVGEPIDSRLRSLPSGVKTVFQTLLAIVFWTAIVGSCVLRNMN